ncbi:MAG TPA: hypothetical protein VFB13_15300 [Reyranella sp.]|nr:hypothetical protein [Reyranella sp.]
MRFSIVLALFLLPLAAMAQEQTSQRPTLKIVGDLSGLTADDRNSYCLWAGQLFSIGAAFCSRQQTLSTCTEVAGRRPMWISKENDKLCDKNLSATPQ